MALPTATRRPVQDVKVFGVQRRATSERTKRPWIVRWAVDGPQRSRSFRTRVEAERFRSLLIEAQRRGEPFDVGTGEPASWRPLPGDQPFHRSARRWLAEQWPEWQPRTRRSAVEALTRVVPLLVDPSAAAPPAGLRAHLVRTLEPGAAIDDVPCERWLDQHGLPLSALRRDVLAAVDVRLGVGDHGQPLAPSTAARFRKVGRACVARAAELEIISSPSTRGHPPPPGDGIARPPRCGAVSTSVACPTPTPWPAPSTPSPPISPAAARTS